jgi:hypothetical protein
MAEPTQADIEGHGSDLWPETTKKPVEKIEKTLDIQYVSGATDHFSGDTAQTIWNGIELAYKKGTKATVPIEYEYQKRKLKIIVFLGNVEVLLTEGL